jgi:hypothetical protein
MKKNKLFSKILLLRRSNMRSISKANKRVLTDSEGISYPYLLGII